MTKALKIVLIIACSFALIGLILLGIGMLLGGFHPKAERKTETIDADFHSIIVKEINADIQILPSEDGVCRIEYGEQEHLPLSVGVSDGTLTLSRTDDTPWYRRISLFSFGGVGATKIYLPTESYNTLQLSTVTGDITIDAGITLDTLTLSTTTGDIVVKALSAGEASLKATTGDMQLSGVLVQGNLTANCVTGDLLLDGCDAEGGISLKTTTGDVLASLLSAKSFSAHSTTGSVQVPASVDGAAPCEIHVVTGSINVTLVS